MGKRWKHAWITGASSGIGEAIALELAARGVECSISARSQEKLRAVAAQSGLIEAFPLDVTDDVAVGRTIDAIETGRGAIDLAVLNAGVWMPSAARELETEVRRRFNCTRFFFGELGPVLGSHTGPGLLGAAICPEAWPLEVAAIQNQEAQTAVSQ